jgi:ribosomal protein S18 acetylase RimI-like enzyme
MRLEEKLKSFVEAVRSSIYLIRLPRRCRLLQIDFCAIKDSHDAAEVANMMRTLYSEDQAASPVDSSSFPLTIQFLIAEPARGRIVLFREGRSLVGYALLIPYWSNEFGGTLLFVDEIFVIPEARNRGIGRSFFRFLEEERPFDAVALALETTPSNIAARRLYESLGFEQRKNLVLTYRFSEIR